MSAGRVAIVAAGLIAVTALIITFRSGDTKTIRTAAPTAGGTAEVEVASRIEAEAPVGVVINRMRCRKASPRMLTCSGRFISRAGSGVVIYHAMRNPNDDRYVISPTIRLKFDHPIESNPPGLTG